MSKKVALVTAVSLLGLGDPAIAGQTGESGLCRNDADLHVPSPEWRDQIVYFLMLDRFEDGDPTNNDQGLGEYDPGDRSRYSGGDLKGVTSRLDYIEGLGATTVWTTPPVANQWWSQEAGYAGYHGYWPRDFTKIDEHYGTLEDYRDLSCALHRRGMFHVMDIVVNHTGDFFSIDDTKKVQEPSLRYRPVNPASPSDAPRNSPFELNDPRRETDRNQAIYNWTPKLENFHDRQSELTHQLAELDDINTQNPLVRQAFKDLFGDWIEKGGVDAFRVDTVKYVEPEFFEDFFHAPDGILNRAQQTGRSNFLLFGEVKENAPAFSIAGEAKMALYFGSQARPIFPSLINFPLQEELVRVLAQGLPTAALSYRLDAFLRYNPDPTLATNFVDNHDVPRFLSQGHLAAFKQALALVFTLPGIPMIYQGNEQAVAETRQAMFEGGYGTDRDLFDPGSEMYLFIRRLAEIRKGNAALRRGSLKVLADNPNLPGVFAFRRDWNGEAVFVIVNTAEHRSLVGAMPTGLPDGTVLTRLLGSQNVPMPSVDGTLSMELAPREIIILAAAAQPEAGLKATPLTKAQPAPEQMARRIVVDGPLPETPLEQSHVLKGQMTGADRSLKLVIDGDLGSAIDVPIGQDGRWTVTLDASDIGTHQHVAQLYAPQSGQVSVAIPYATVRKGADWQASLADPADDDHGPDGTYLPPSDASFVGQQDILGAEVRTGGDVLELELRMRATSADWQPSNGFDHVAFTTFIELPGQAGMTRSDDINAVMPNGFGWSAAHTLFGWGNSIMLPTNRRIGRAPKVQVDHARKTITISYSAKALGVETWNGARLYVTTFDREGEGELRRTTATGGPMAFRGSPDGPRIMDDMLIEIGPR